MQTPDGLRKAAERHRRLAQNVTDDQAVEAIKELADRYDRAAADLQEALLVHAIQIRAHEIWIANGRPEGRDLDHWLQAEREIMKPAASPGMLRRPGAPARCR